MNLVSSRKLISYTDIDIQSVSTRTTQTVLQCIHCIHPKLRRYHVITLMELITDVLWN